MALNELIWIVSNLISYFLSPLHEFVWVSVVMGGRYLGIFLFSFSVTLQLRFSVRAAACIVAATFPWLAQQNLLVSFLWSDNECDRAGMRNTLLPFCRRGRRRSVMPRADIAVRNAARDVRACVQSPWRRNCGDGLRSPFTSLVWQNSSFPVRLESRFSWRLGLAEVSVWLRSRFD